MKNKPRVLVLNGPNLNLLGTREPEVYGTRTLPEINDDLEAKSGVMGLSLDFFQSNHEGELIDRIHRAAAEEIKFIVFNPAGYTHTSVALRDALLSVGIPFIEVHLTDPKQREPFRHHSLFSDIAVTVISGFGACGYEKALLIVTEELGAGGVMKIEKRPG